MGVVKRFHIKNFKSLSDFHLPGGPGVLGNLICLVGLNGSGKSSVLQAFDFVGQLASGGISSWLAQRGWTASDLVTQLPPKRPRTISFNLEFEFSQSRQVVWSGDYNLSSNNCIAEEVKYGGDTVLQIKGRGEKSELHLRKLDDTFETIPLSKLQFEGSAMSLVKPESYHPALALVKTFARQMRSLELLSPQAMRKRAREGDVIGLGGEKLAGYLHSLPEAKRSALDEALSEFYPHFESLKTKSFPSGWKELILNEIWGGKLQTRARHVNDGLLRLAAILSQLDSSESDPTAPKLLLLDEIENGINPEVVQLLIHKLIASRHQILLTTHSPMILNWLPDEVAKLAVILLYRTEQGATKATRLFDIPSAGERLGILGPGEVFVDVNLNLLSHEAERWANA